MQGLVYVILVEMEMAEVMLDMAATKGKHFGKKINYLNKKDACGT